MCIPHKGLVQQVLNQMLKGIAEKSERSAVMVVICNSDLYYDNLGGRFSNSDMFDGNLGGEVNNSNVYDDNLGGRVSNNDVYDGNLGGSRYRSLCTLSHRNNHCTLVS